MKTLQAIIMMVSLMVLTGCANTKTAAGALAHGMVDSGCAIAHKGVDLAFGPITDVQADAGAVSDAAKELVK